MGQSWAEWGLGGRGCAWTQDWWGMIVVGAKMDCVGWWGWAARWIGCGEGGGGKMDCGGCCVWGEMDCVEWEVQGGGLGFRV